jgi:hypothetical protein
MAGTPPYRPPLAPTPSAPPRGAWPFDVTLRPDGPDEEDWREASWRPPPPPPAGPAKPAEGAVLVAGGLLGLSAGVHIAAMFPAYSGNPPTSVASTPYEMAIYICLAVGWTAAAALVLTMSSVRGGVALGGAIAAIELGFLITDLAGADQASGGATPGLWLAFAALALGGAGVLLGASTVPLGGPRLRPYAESFSPRAVLTVLAAVVAVAAFLPSWDRYEIVNSAGRTATVTLGNAFSQPAGVMAGELVAALAIGLIAILAAFWAPPTVGAWMTAGVVIALASQLISAAVQVNQPLSAAGAGERATMSLTGYWAIDVGAAVALAGLALWAGLSPQPGQVRSPASGHVLSRG